MSATEHGLHLQQRQFSLPVADRTVLINLETVRANKGWDAQSVLALVENYELRWVFDIALGASRRELRFWTGEFFQPERARKMRLSEVVSNIVGSSPTLARAELERQWVCGAQTIMRLVKSGDLNEIVPGRVTRASVVDYLTRSWFGNDPALAKLEQLQKETV